MGDWTKLERGTGGRPKRAEGRKESAPDLVLGGKESFGKAYRAFQALPSWLTQTRLLSFTISKAGGAD